MIPRCSAVFGHFICIKPKASELDTALGLRPLSTLATAATRDGSNSYWVAEASKHSLNGNEVSAPEDMEMIARGRRMNLGMFSLSLFIRCDEFEGP